RQQELEERTIDLDSLNARLRVQEESQVARDADLKRREKEADREGRRLARAHLMEARQRVEDALAQARGAVDDSAAREARRLVEEGIVELAERAEEAEEAEKAEKAERAEKGTVEIGDRVQLSAGGSGQ